MHGSAIVCGRVKAGVLLTTLVTTKSSFSCEPLSFVVHELDMARFMTVALLAVVVQMAARPSLVLVAHILRSVYKHL